MGRNRGGTAALLTLAIALAAATEGVQLPFGREAWTGDLDGMLERQRIRALVVERELVQERERDKQGITVDEADVHP